MEENKLPQHIHRKDNQDDTLKLNLSSRIYSLPSIRLDFSLQSESQERGEYKKKMLLKSKINFTQPRSNNGARSYSGSDINTQSFRNVYEKSFSVPTPSYQANTNDDNSSGKMFFSANQPDLTFSSPTSQTNSETFTSKLQGEQYSGEYHLHYTN